MYEIAAVESEELGVARDMLAIGVVLADYESRFDRTLGFVSDDFHREWELAVSTWWELAARYECLNRGSQVGRGANHIASDAETAISDNPKISDPASVAHTASIARMCRLPASGGS